MVLLVILSPQLGQTMGAGTLARSEESICWSFAVMFFSMVITPLQ